MSPRHSLQGFTLIELMVAVAILGILAALAYSSYTAQAQQGRRSDALNALGSLSQSLERCYAQNYTYTGCPAVPAAVTSSTNGYYQVTATPAATGYTLVAVPTGVQAKDTICAKFIQSNSGQSAQNSAGTDQTQTCWGSR